MSNPSRMADMAIKHRALDRTTPIGVKPGRRPMPAANAAGGCLYVHVLARQALRMRSLSDAP
jgi:hypothetical protein